MIKSHDHKTNAPNNVTMMELQPTPPPSKGSQNSLDESMSSKMSVESKPAPLSNECRQGMDQSSLSSKTFLSMILFFFDDVMAKFFGQQAAGAVFPPSRVFIEKEIPVSPISSPALSRHPAEATRTPNAAATPTAHTPPAFIFGTPLKIKDHQPQATPFEQQEHPFSSTPVTAPSTPWSPESSETRLASNSNASLFAFQDHELQRLSIPEEMDSIGVHTALSQEKRCILNNHERHSLANLPFLRPNPNVETNVRHHIERLQNVDNHNVALPNFQCSPYQDEGRYIHHQDITKTDVFLGQEHEHRHLHPEQNHATGTLAPPSPKVPAPFSTSEHERVFVGPDHVTEHIDHHGQQNSSKATPRVSAQFSPSKNARISTDLETKDTSSIKLGPDNQAQDNGRELIEQHRDQNDNVVMLGLTARFSPSEHERIYIKYKDITLDDVYCGQEHRRNLHPGNVAFRRTIEENGTKYKAFGRSHGKKTKLSTSLLEEVMKGRFVKMDPVKGHYFFLLTKEEARYKVSQALCDK